MIGEIRLRVLAVLAVLLLPLTILGGPAGAETAHEGQVIRLYLAYFERRPEPAGLTYWAGRIAGGTPLAVLSQQFTGTAEFQNRYGSLDDGEFVDLVYANVLGRAPDAAGRAHWVGVLTSRRLTRGAVMIGFSESPEFVRITGTTPPPRPPAPLAVGPAGLRQKAAAPTVFDAADPAVLVAGGRTWLFGSTNNKKLPVRELTAFPGSLPTSQTQWAQSPGEAMGTRPAWVDPGEWQIWAPTLTTIANRYYVYFAAARAGATDEANDQCIGRAVASSPNGPYEPEATPVYCGLKPDAGANSWGRGALDPEVVRTASGSMYLLVALSRTTDNIGVVSLGSDGRVAGGLNAAPKTLVRQKLTWHDGTDDSSLGAGAFLENPSMIHDVNTDTWLLFYSAGQWYTSRYVTGFARCSTPVGPCVTDDRGPFLVGGNGRTGVGGLTAFRDAQGVARVAYASWTAGQENQVGSVGQYKRQTTLQTIRFGSGTTPATQSVTLG